MTRLSKISLLLRHSESEKICYEPGAGIWGGYRSADKGPSPSFQRECYRCQGVGKLLGNVPCRPCRDALDVRHKCSRCALCLGKRKLWHDSYLWAQYVANKRLMPIEKTVVGGMDKKQRVATSPPKRPKKYSGSDPTMLAADVYRTLRASHHGSMADLDACMSRLHREDEVGHSIVRRYHRESWTPSPAEALCLAICLLKLDEWMPHKIVVPARLLVKEMERDGKSINATSKELGIRKSKVRRARAA